MALWVPSLGNEWLLLFDLQAACHLHLSPNLAAFSVSSHWALLQELWLGLGLGPRLHTCCLFLTLCCPLVASSHPAML